MKIVLGDDQEAGSLVLGFASGIEAAIRGATQVTGGASGRTLANRRGTTGTASPRTSVTGRSTAPRPPQRGSQREQ